MGNSKCPLGEDCDLTLAYMAGAHDAKKGYAAEIERLREALWKIYKHQKRMPNIDVTIWNIARSALEEKSND